jgi:hypothetical protein
MKMYLSINATDKIYMSGCTFLASPVNALITVYEIIPKAIPSDIEYVIGITITVKNAGIPTLKSVKLTLVIDPFI